MCARTAFYILYHFAFKKRDLTVSTPHFSFSSIWQYCKSSSKKKQKKFKGCQQTSQDLYIFCYMSNSILLSSVKSDKCSSSYFIFKYAATNIEFHWRWKTVIRACRGAKLHDIWAEFSELVCVCLSVQTHALIWSETLEGTWHDEIQLKRVDSVLQSICCKGYIKSLKTDYFAEH